MRGTRQAASARRGSAQGLAQVSKAAQASKSAREAFLNAGNKGTDEAGEAPARGTRRAASARRGSAQAVMPSAELQHLQSLQVLPRVVSLSEL